MDTFITLLRNELQKVIDNIDAGNSYLSEEDSINLISSIKQFTHKDEYYTKYEACKCLGKSRATFDNLVAAGELPQGEKRHAGDNTLFWKAVDILKYKHRNAKRS